MPTVQFKQELSMNDLLKVVEQFSSKELEEFIQRVQVLKQQKNTVKTNTKQAELIAIIKRNLTDTEQKRFKTLVQKRQAYSITEAELMELIELTDYSEQLNAERIKALADLAHLTQRSANEWVQVLNIRPYDE
jgi:hypothetical protein